ncbi:phosphate transporter PHO1 homolog 7-like [Salvia splendens]|uniref:phosphate transporter PHO1 homolog 7-like n=1 Tax=Salvia splendens TaxID=180675 RepID=UPI001C275DD0|nr:phosphate transporter PHO1 homolog 7-like [Salvia splendens]
MLRKLGFRKWSVTYYVSDCFRSASNVYLQMLDNSFRANSNEVYELMERLEAAFIEWFAQGNRGKGKKSLRLGEKREKHRITFLLGLFTGCSVALVIAVIVSMHARDLLNHTGRDEYMESIFPLYSWFGFIVLHLLMYGSNAYLWRRFRVNYPSIIGFTEETDLSFRKVLLLASALSVLSLAAVLSNLDMEMDLRTMKYSTVTELVPLTLVLLVLLVTFCPFNILYHSSRFFFLRHAWHCASAPLQKGTFTDFFLEDQLTSQVQAIRSLLFYLFYYTMGDFTTRSNAFLNQKLYKALYIVVAIIPSWWRLLQCLCRLYEEC